jgi:predicted DNA-binding transcriptional regulator YafY
MTPAFETAPSSQSQLYEILSRGRRLTQSEAADIIDVSQRQVRNLVAELRESGVPVQSTFVDRKRVYFLQAKDWRADTVSLDLTEQQLMALLVATRAAQPTLSPTPLCKSIERVTTVLEEELEAHVDTFIPSFESERWHFNRSVSTDLDPHVFWTLKTAIANRNPVFIDYYSAHRESWSRDRKIDPLLFAVRKGAWLCVAYCHKRSTCLDFNLVDINSVTICNNEHFTPPSGFDRREYFEDRFGAIQGGSQHTVVLQVSSHLARYFKRKRYHPTQKIEEKKDGIRVTFSVRGLEEIASFVRSWGPGVKVIEPSELVDRIKSDAQSVLDNYSGDGS